MGIAVGDANGFEFTANDYVRGQQQVEEFFGYVNEERQRRGLSTLEVRRELCVAARRHAEDMVKNQYLAYIAPGTGYDIRHWAAEAGWPSEGVAETMAAGSESVYEVFQLWMSHAGSANLLMADSEDRIEFAGFGLAWERDLDVHLLPDTRWVFVIGFEDLEMGTSGIPDGIAGYPAREEWKTPGNVIVVPGVTGGTWYGFRRPSDEESRMDRRQLPTRHIRIKAKRGQRIARSQIAPKKGRIDRIQIVRGKLPAGVRLNRNTGRLTGIPKATRNRSIMLLYHVRTSNGIAAQPVSLRMKIR